MTPTTRFAPRRLHARIAASPESSPAAGEIAVYRVALVDRTFDASVGVVAGSSTDRGRELHAAGPPGLAIGDLVTIDRRGNRWWMSDAFRAADLGEIGLPYLVVSTASTLDPITVLDARGVFQRQITAGGTFGTMPAIGPDHRIVGLYGGTTVVVWNTDGSVRWTKTITQSVGGLGRFAWEESTGHIVGLERNGTGQIRSIRMDGDTGATLATENAVYTTSGGEVAVKASDSTVYVAYAEGGGPYRIRELEPGSLAFVKSTGGADFVPSQSDLVVSDVGSLFYLEHRTNSHVVKFDASLTSQTRGPRVSTFVPPFTLLPAENYVANLHFYGGRLGRFSDLTTTPDFVWLTTTDYDSPIYDRRAGRLFCFKVSTSEVVELDPDTGEETAENWTPYALPNRPKSIDVYPGRDAAW